VKRFEELLHDADMKRLMDFYKCYRACVRGKVASLTSNAEGLTAEEKAAKLELAGRYYGLALKYAIAGSSPQAFVFMGRIASGKSSLAKDFSRQTGWTVLSSDQLRKELAGVDLHTRGSEEERTVLYAPGMTKRTYDAMFDAGIEALRAGRNVILDATFSSREHRDALRQRLDEAGFGCTWVAAHASDEVTKERLARRAQSEHVVSDARLEDFEKLTSRFEAPDELPDDITIRISTEGSPGSTLRQLMLELAERGVRRQPR
jgi:predicted kinase